MRALSPRENRAVALLIATAALAVVVLGVVEPLIDSFADRAAARAAIVQRHAANARMIAAIPRLVREAARREAELDRLVLPTADPAVAADILRTRISAATSAVDGDFRGTEDGPATPGKAAIHANVRVTAEQMQRLIAMLENGRPFLSVGAITVNADAALVAGAATPLDLGLDITAPLRTRQKVRP